MPISDLRKMRDQADEPVERKGLPPLPGHISTVLAFDQALGNTGVVIYDGVSLHATTLRASQESKDLTGVARTMAQAHELQRKICEIIYGTFVQSRAKRGQMQVAYESPIVMGPSRRTESSYLSAYIIERESREVGVEPEFVSNQRAKTLATGSPKATKADIKKSIAARYTEDVVAALHNEHERDAFLVLVTYIERASA